MNRSYSSYTNIIDELENIEQVIITENKTKKCCYYSLEILKLGIQYIKNRNVNVNINGKEEKEKNKHKTGLSVSSTDEDSGEIVKETSVIEVACPMCKKMLELKMN